MLSDILNCHNGAKNQTSGSILTAGSLIQPFIALPDPKKVNADTIDENDTTYHKNETL